MLEIILDEFHPSTMWNGGIFIYISFVLIIYFLLLPPSKNHSLKKSIVFILGLLAIFASLGSPINVIARIMYSSHIIQLVLLFFVASPLLIYGFKYEIIERWKKNETFAYMLKIVTNPWVALVTFYVLFYSYHIPAVFNSVRLDLFANYFAMIVLFIAAILLFHPLLLNTSLSDKTKWTYALLNILLIVPYSVVLIVADSGIYALYTDVRLFMSSIMVCLPDADLMTPEFFRALMPFDPVMEQLRGGILLLIAQVAIFTTVGFLGRKRK